MIITAKASHISHSPRKVNLVAKSIVGLPAAKALEQLNFTFKRASNPVSKVLKQAIANATNNLKLDAKSLVVETAFATKGRTLKRGLFGGRMRYKPFERTASHLTINLKSVAPRAKQDPAQLDKAVPVKKVSTKRK
ncbi:50S ribosomal protein L22 [Candidatus Collierbacteria bacterium RIFCSPLOWO2_01_FULL_50_23]|uniref:50S ribosomal protein L22 n=2 Tax=Candidatus Collieribacteriota TaxID=1752725 RepID=A0A1F5EUP7_9BACT|nr:ribosomal protein L22 [uncultured bacterium]OGD71113.1 MAG: 50S ribosomal protein L22 [Candidatus Collierbacteria bacterium RIFCSPHIGHO2_02_FULL_49_10]OGD71663.1 MAG: 50S ribosomal protein L22 [Candidatus Collierbacteria bacterium RIFCSPHIGHO2_01_FULL_50_25]OGD73975.1 MAG: 50S ribosomal protein L22 [Candidatus Collierbacteria bacterium RIFCSPLOWO2_01_FULL_50_23]